MESTPQEVPAESLQLEDIALLLEASTPKPLSGFKLYVLVVFAVLTALAIHELFIHFYGQHRLEQGQAQQAAEAQSRQLDSDRVEREAMARRQEEVRQLEAAEERRQWKANCDVWRRSYNENPTPQNQNGMQHACSKALPSLQGNGLQ